MILCTCPVGRILVKLRGELCEKLQIPRKYPRNIPFYLRAIIHVSNTMDSIRSPGTKEQRQKSLTCVNGLSGSAPVVIDSIHMSPSSNKTAQDVLHGEDGLPGWRVFDLFQKRNKVLLIVLISPEENHSQFQRECE